MRQWTKTSNKVPGMWYVFKISSGFHLLHHKFSSSQPIFFNLTGFLWQRSGHSWARLLFNVLKGCNQGVSLAALLSGAQSSHLSSLGGWQNSVTHSCKADFFTFLVTVHGRATQLLETTHSSFPSGPLTDPLTTWQLASSRPVRESLCPVW